MKNIKKLIQICFALVAVFSVVALTKMDAKAATRQITGLKQTEAYPNGVDIAWDDVAGTDYAEATYRVKGNKAWQGSQYGQESQYGFYINNLKSGTSYDVKVKLYSLDTSGRSHFVAESPTIEVVTEPGQDASFSMKQTKASASSATVSWSAYDGANGYIIRKSPLGESNVKTTFVTGRSKKLTGLKKNEDTYIEVIPCRKSSTGFVAESSSTCPTLRVAVVPSKSRVQYTDIFKKNVKIGATSNCHFYEDGYDCDIYRINGKKWKRIKTVKSIKMTDECEYSNKAFAKNDLFRVRVHSYKKAENGKKFYSGWSSWYYFCTPGVIKTGSVKSVGSRGIQVEWDKINGASGYKVYASTKNDRKKFKVVATIKKGSTTKVTFRKLNKKALKKGKRYYVYVAPYYKSGKKTYSLKNLWYLQDFTVY